MQANEYNCSINQDMPCKMSESKVSMISYRAAWKVAGILGGITASIVIPLIGIVGWIFVDSRDVERKMFDKIATKIDRLTEVVSLNSVARSDMDNIKRDIERIKERMAKR